MNETIEKKYNITKEHCHRLIHGVCGGCGGKVTPIETKDNAGRPTFWPGCRHCEVASFGTAVGEKHFKVARFLVENKILIPYKHIRNNAWHWLESQTAGLSHTIGQIDKLLNEFSEQGE